MNSILTIGCGLVGFFVGGAISEWTGHGFWLGAWIGLVIGILIRYCPDVIEHIDFD